MSFKQQFNPNFLNQYIEMNISDYNDILNIPEDAPGCDILNIVLIKKFMIIF